MRAPSPRSLIVPLALFAILATPPSADARRPPPPGLLHVAMIGPKAIKLRVYGGSGLPCDSSMNTRYVDARVQPGFVFDQIVGPYAFCFQQTYPGSLEEWTEPQVVERPIGYEPDGRGKTMSLTFTSNPK